MVTREEYALLSENVYGNSSSVRSTRNVLPIPNYWTELDVSPIGSTSTGFMASAYQSPNGSEIVIAYAGTTTENWVDWWSGNVPAATAAYFPKQVYEAARFYLDVHLLTWPPWFLYLNNLSFLRLFFGVPILI
jgi:hypothetical protein